MADLESVYGVNAAAFPTSAEAELVNRLRESTDSFISLVEAGLKQCEHAEIGAVVVLGHPEYYPRFGFIPASQFEISCEYDVPDEVFMAMEIRSGYLDNLHGTISYHPAFAKL